MPEVSSALSLSSKRNYQPCRAALQTIQGKSVTSSNSLLEFLCQTGPLVLWDLHFSLVNWPFTTVVASTKLALGQVELDACQIFLKWKLDSQLFSPLSLLPLVLMSIFISPQAKRFLSSCLFQQPWWVLNHLCPLISVAFSMFQLLFGFCLPFLVLGKWLFCIARCSLLGGGGGFACWF